MCDAMSERWPSTLPAGTNSYRGANMALSRENRDQQVKFPTNDGFRQQDRQARVQSPHWSKFVSSDASEDSINNCLGVLVTEGRRPQ